MGKNATQASERNQSGMSATTPYNPWPLSELEAEEFRALGLTPGHWIALAPVPLFRSDFDTPHPNDLQTLAKLQYPLRSEAGHATDHERAAESEAFWKRLCIRSFPTASLERGTSLLAWYISRSLPRPERETYLSVLDAVSARFLRIPRSPVAGPSASERLRQRLERYLPQSAFTLDPSEPRLPPPDPSQVAVVFGADLWKQMLVAPIAAALVDVRARVPAAFSVAEVLARVTVPNLYNKPYPLEPHLASGCWRRLFEGLLNPEQRESTEPAIRAGLDIAARGLASLPFGEREKLLRTIHEQIERAIDRSDQKKITADEWIDRMRTKVEDVIRQASPPTDSLPSSRTVANTILHTGMAASQPNTMPGQPSTAIKPTPGPSPVIAHKASHPVERANPFTTIPWEEALALAGQVKYSEIRNWLTNPERLSMLFDDARAECPEVAIVRDAKKVPSSLWIIGDIHADVLTLVNIIAHAERTATLKGDEEPPAYVFLGDFVDRGRHDHETLLLLLQLAIKNPGRVCIVPGNHDIDLQWDEKRERFRVSIEPAEYCERLNALIQSNDPAGNEQVEFARLLISFWQSRPKAVFLPDGTMLAHGGFPHSDMHAVLRTPADLARPNCLSDFMWARLAETARKRPNRGNRGHEFGWETLAQFCNTAANMGLSVKRFVRGHDHVPQRWQTYPDYREYPVLTINAMGRRMDGEPDPAEGPYPFPVMARHVPDQLPVVVQLPLDARDVNRAIGKDPGEAVREASPVGNNREGTRGEPLPNEALDEIARGVQLDAETELMLKKNANPENR